MPMLISLGRDPAWLLSAGNDMKGEGGMDRLRRNQIRVDKLVLEVSM